MPGLPVAAEGVDRMVEGSATTFREVPRREQAWQRRHHVGGGDLVPSCPLLRRARESTGGEFTLRFAEE